jgi:predicted phage terminase large subunit-like protein
VLSIDAAMAAGEDNSCSAIQAWAREGDQHYLIDRWREQCDYDDLERAYKRLYRRHRPIAVLIEKAGGGHALISRFKRKHRCIRKIIPQGSKTARFHRHIEAILDRRILLPEDAPWLDDFVEELHDFPHGRFADQVDALSQYLDWIEQQPSEDSSLASAPQKGLAVAGFHSTGQRREAQPNDQNVPQRGLCAGANSSGLPITGKPHNPPFPRVKAWVQY